jgi:8-oxo-dGTP diphosphatase
MENPSRYEPVDWEQWNPNMRATLLFIRRGDEVLLMRKKRGLGAGKVNGPGGKIDPGETPAECAVRETQEELRVTAFDPDHRGTLRFQFADGLAIQCEVFTATRFEGEPTETEEGAPLWCRIEAIPYDQMWADDAHWLPGVLAGKRFESWFVFDNERMLSHRIEWAGSGG